MSIKNVGKYKLGWKRLAVEEQGVEEEENHMRSINSLYVFFPLRNNVKYLQCYKNKGRLNRRQKIMWGQRKCIKRNFHVYKI